MIQYSIGGQLESFIVSLGLMIRCFNVSLVLEFNVSMY